MTHRLNLAKRPFVDTRPANIVAAVLVLLVVGLSFVSFRTLARYRAESAKTRGAIAALNAEIVGLEDSRRAAEAALARFDVDELAASASDAEQIVRRRDFSWTRFLTHLEQTLPADVRVASIALSRHGEGKGGAHALPSDVMDVELVLISRDPEGLPKTIRALYASPYFDRPVPHSEEGGDRGTPEGRRLTLGVTYRDTGGAIAKNAEGPPEGPTPTPTPPPQPARKRSAVVAPAAPRGTAVPSGRPR